MAPMYYLISAARQKYNLIVISSTILVHKQKLKTKSDFVGQK